MKHQWQVLYYETEDEICPVKEFIDSQNKRNKAKIFSLISYLEEIGPQLPRPYADLLREGIHEMRVKLTGEQVRILYFFCYRNFIILTHVFKKTTDKIPDAEIKKAKKYRDDFLTRHDEKTLKEFTDEDV